MRTREDQNRWLEEWYDWFHRVERYLKLDPEASISYQQCAYLIVAIDRDAVAGELFSTQLPPGEGREATWRVIRSLDTLSRRLCIRLLANPSAPYPTGNEAMPKHQPQTGEDPE